jgi:hypothetical protein
VARFLLYYVHFLALSASIWARRSFFLGSSFLSVGLFLPPLSVSAQAPVLQWSHVFGTPGMNTLKRLRSTADGGYILGGWTDAVSGGDRSQPSRGSDDFWLLKVDAQGRKQWDQTLGGQGLDYLQDVQQTADGGYLVGGYTTSAQSGDKTQPSRGLNDYWIVKLDARGNKQWDRTFGGTGNDYLSSLQQTTDGGYLLGGSSSSPISGDKTQFSDYQSDYWVVKVDARGNKQWDRTVGGDAYEMLYTVRQSPDGGYVLGGFTMSGVSGDKTQPSRGEADFWLVKLNATGQPQWDRTYGGRASEILVELQLTADGGYILGGTSGSGISGDKSEPSRGASGDYWVVKVDAQGNKQWDRTIGGSAYDQLVDLQVSSDGGYLLGGYSSSPISGEKSEPNLGYEDAWVVKLDVNGTREWDHTFGADESDYLGSFLPTTDGGYIVGGYTYSASLLTTKPASPSDSDLWAFKFEVAPPTIKIIGDSVLCAGGQLPLTASASYSTATYRWSTGATTPTITVNQAGTYQVTATFANGQVSTAQQHVKAVTPSLLIQGDSLLCPGQPLTLTATGTPGATYFWSTGARTPSIVVTQSGRYTVTAHYGSGCVVTQQVLLRTPTLQLSGSPLLCANEGARTTLSAIAPGATAYRWSTGATTPSLVVTQAGSYAVVATFANGCTLTATQQITAPSVVIRGDSLLCAGQSVQLTAGGSVATAYRWSTGATTSTLSVRAPGTYSLTAFYATGCSSSATVRVHAAPPMAAFTLGADTTVCEGTTLLLHAPFSTGQLSYRWSDGSTSNSLLVRAAGMYTLVVSTPCDTRTVTRHIAYKSCLFLPNVVTANRDGQNDYFAPAGLVGGNWGLTIYNRWGRQVYEATSYANDWGQDAAPGIYYYVLQQAATGVRYKGSVEVIR